MEPASLLAHYSAIAADHNYTLLEGQPLSQLPDTSWYIPTLPAPPIPFVLGQRVLLLSLPSRIFFGCLRSIVRLERSYLVVTVSPEPTAYGPCLPRPLLEIIRIVVVCLLHYISVKCTTVDICSTLVPSVACQTTEVILQVSYPFLPTG